MTIQRKNPVVRRLALMVLALQALLWKASIAVAQGPDIEVQINPQRDGGAVWYATWWVWVLIAVFIIVVVALTSRGKSSP